MPAFQVLVIKEHIRGEIRQLDNRIAILYDSEDDKYYFYGTRNHPGQNTYTPYGGTYSYSQWKSFSLFLEFVLGKYEEVLTIETHFLDIREKDYDVLCWDYFANNLTNRSLLAAYDMKMVSVETMENYLDMLIHC
jgi:hypothetical protein